MSIDKSALVGIRDHEPGDRNFILATFLRGLYYGDSWFSLIPKKVFMENYHKIIERLIDLPDVKISIACLKEDPEVILGYSIVRLQPGNTILDWVFVKSAWRGIGIGKSLVPQDLKTVTHLTKVGKVLKPDKCDFNPFV